MYTHSKVAADSKLKGTSMFQSKQSWCVTKTRITKREQFRRLFLHRADNWTRKHLLSRNKQNNKQPTTTGVWGLRKHTEYLTWCPRNTVGSLTISFLAEHITISPQSSFLQFQPQPSPDPNPGSSIKQEEMSRYLTRKSSLKGGFSENIGNWWKLLLHEEKEEMMLLKMT